MGGEGSFWQSNMCIRNTQTLAHDPPKNINLQPSDDCISITWRKYPTPAGLFKLILQKRKRNLRTQVVIRSTFWSTDETCQAMITSEKPECGVKTKLFPLPVSTHYTTVVIVVLCRGAVKGKGNTPGKQSYYLFVASFETTLISTWCVLSVHFSVLVSRSRLWRRTDSLLKSNKSQH